jgi:hypothetical protein
MREVRIGTGIGVLVGAVSWLGAWIGFRLFGDR